jgi:hypothetical protein
MTGVDCSSSSCATPMTIGRRPSSRWIVSTLISSATAADPVAPPGDALSPAVPPLLIGLMLSWAAAPGWIGLIMMWPNRVGGIAATCAEAFRPDSPVLANLTGVCYWWGWIPTCGLTAILSSEALHEWYLPGMRSSGWAR